MLALRSGCRCVLPPCRPAARHNAYSTSVAAHVWLPGQVSLSKCLSWRAPAFSAAVATGCGLSSSCGAIGGAASTPTSHALAAAIRDEGPPVGTVLSVEPTTLRGFLRLVFRALWLGSLLSIPCALGAACLLLPSSWRPQRAAESWLVWALRRGGVCTIKFGQWASTRPDILPPSLCATLGELHSGAPAHPLWETQRQIAAAFSAEECSHIAEVFPEPLGSGAIAQVHEAVARDGTRLAVKVVHPGVAASVAIDLWLLRAAASAVEALTPLHGVRWLALPEAAEQFSSFMQQQLDMRTEAHNLVRFALNFSDSSGVAKLTFPAPFAGLVSRDVLVETYVAGQPISAMFALDRAEAEAAASLGARGVAGATREGAREAEAAALRERAARKALARRGLQAFLKMVLVDNFVHADLHPGNILVEWRSQSEEQGARAEGALRRNSSGGAPALAFVDAGLVVELSARDQRNFVLLFYAIAQGDGARAADLMLEYAPQHACADAGPFRAGMANIVARARCGSDGALSLSTLRIGDVLLEVTSLVRAHHVKMDPAFTTLVMAIGVLEGLGRQLDPDLNLFSVAMPLLLESPFVCEVVWS